MLGKITRTLMHTSIAQPKIVIESGTGTGKTLGYLIPSLLCARETQKKVVIATATISLQAQLLEKDIPLLAECVDGGTVARLAKGRRRYLCPIRIEHTRFEAGQPSENLIRPLSDSQRALVEGLYQNFHSGDWDGDLDAWDASIDSELIPLITADQSNCRGRRCEAIEECPFYSARDELDDAEIVVTNHSLVLADLELGGGVVLPAPEESIYVFDEAHHLAEKAINAQTHSLQVGSTVNWLETLLKRLKESEKILPEGQGAGACKRLSQSINALVSQLGPMQDSILDWLGSTISEPRWSRSARHIPQYRLAPGQVPQAIQDAAQQGKAPCQLALAELDTLIDTFKADAERTNGDLDTEVARNQQAFYTEARVRIDRAQKLLTRYAQVDPAQPEARWILVRGIEQTSQLHEGDPELWYGPADAAEGLQSQLWSQCAGAVLCSATLAVNGRFDRTYQSLGLDMETPCYIVPGEFNYAENGQIVVPPYAVNPQSSIEAHDAAILEHLETLWGKDIGALVLFSSRAQLERIYAEVTNSQATQVLSQSALGKSAIVGHHQLRRDQRETSIIFGNQSFYEGIDLPGHLLEEVVITRLPFNQPDDPIQATYIEWIEQRNGKPFFEVTLPLASIRLRQAVGRLIRTEQDRGQVTILDERIRTKGYGAQLIRDLPDFRLVGL